MMPKDLTPSPLDKDISLREQVLQLAGISPFTLSALLKEAVSTVQEKLTAKDTKFFTHQGEVISTEHVEAHAIQLSAAQEIIRLTSALAALGAKGSGVAKSGPVNIQVNMPTAPVPSLQSKESEILAPTAQEVEYIISTEKEPADEPSRDPCPLSDESAQRQSGGSY